MGTHTCTHFTHLPSLKYLKDCFKHHPLTRIHTERDRERESTMRLPLVLCAGVAQVMAATSYSAEALKDEITYLPDAPNVDFKMFSGYINVAPSRSLFYWFVEKQDSVTSDRPGLQWPWRLHVRARLLSPDRARRFSGSEPLRLEQVGAHGLYRAACRRRILDGAHWVQQLHGCDLRSRHAYVC